MYAVHYKCKLHITFEKDIVYNLKGHTIFKKIKIRTKAKLRFVSKQSIRLRIDLQPQTKETKSINIYIKL